MYNNSISTVAPRPRPTFPPPVVAPLTIGLGAHIFLDVACLRFFDGTMYHFNDPSLLRLALTHKTRGGGTLPHNQGLALHGDDVLEREFNRVQKARGLDDDDRERMFKNGVCLNRYLAWIADRFGITCQIRDVRGFPVERSQLSVHDRATAVEALIGAVDEDTGNNAVPLWDFMKRLHVAWPAEEGKDGDMNQAMRLFSDVEPYYCYTMVRE